ncbi:MAG: hypothetical protein AABY75_01900 [Bacteroidota bacterium]
MPIEREKIRAALLSKGFREGRSDHKYYYLFVDGRKVNVFTYLSHGSGYKEYSDGLVSKVAQQVGLVKKEFLEFVECPLTHEKHVALLRQRDRIK